MQAKKRDETHGHKEEQQGKELEHQRKEIERIKAQISASAAALATYAGTCVASPRGCCRSAPVVRVRELQREVESRGDGQESRPSPQARERTRGEAGGRTIVHATRGFTETGGYTGGAGSGEWVRSLGRHEFGSHGGALPQGCLIAFSSRRESAEASL